MLCHICHGGTVRVKVYIHAACDHVAVVRRRDIVARTTAGGGAITFREGFWIAARARGSARHRETRRPRSTTAYSHTVFVALAACAFDRLY